MLFKSCYVQSRGVSHSYDYEWKKITGNELQHDNAGFTSDINNFLDTEYEPFSLLIVRNKEGLYLIITGLRSNRKDFQGRVIRNSLAFIFDNKKERELRDIAVRFLGGEAESIRNKLDQIITNNDKLGFHVENNSFSQLFSDSGNARNDKKPQKNESKIGFNNKELLNSLANTLRDTQLPTRQGALVVVTGIKKPEKLANVWRALCSLEKSKDDWRTLANQNKMPIKILIMIGIILLVLIMSLFITFNKDDSFNGKPPTKKQSEDSSTLSY